MSDAREVYASVFERDWGIVRDLLHNRAAPAYWIHPDNSCSTLHVAFERNAPIDVVESLVSRLTEKQIGSVSSCGGSVLHAGARHGATIPVFLAVFAKAEKGLINRVDDGGRTPLSVAILAGAPASVIDLFLKKDANPNIADLQGFTALHTAIQGGATQAVVASLLADSRTLKDATTNAGHSALMLAMNSGSPPPIVELLIRAGANVNQVSEAGDGSTPLLLAVYLKASPAIVSLLLAAKADPKAKLSSTGEDAMLLAKNLPASQDVISLLTEALAPQVIPPLGQRPGAFNRVKLEDFATPRGRV